MTTFSDPDSDPDSNRQENSVKFRNVDTGKYLDSSAKGEVYAFDGNGGNNQRWIIEKADKGINLRNLETNRVLDSNEMGDVYTSEANGGDFQKWVYSDQVLVNLATRRSIANFAGSIRGLPFFDRIVMDIQKWSQEN